MREYVDKFIAEAEELIDKAEKNILDLEKDGSNKELITEVFRTLHTLKGSSTMFGFQDISELAHEAEAIYTELCNNKLCFDQQIAEVTLNALDIFKKMFKKIDCTDDISKLKTSLNEILNRHQDIQSEDKPVPGKQQLIYYLVFKPNHDLLKRGINPNYVFEDLEDVGQFETIAHNTEVPLEEQIQQKKITSFWEIYLKTSQSEDSIKEVFIFYNNDEYCLLQIDAQNFITNESFINLLKQFYPNPETEFDNIHQTLNKLLNIEIAPPSEEIIEETKEPPSQNAPSNSGNGNTKEYANIDYISVASNKLDTMINLVSELITAHAELNTVANQHRIQELEDTVEKIGKLSRKFRSNALELRLVPLKILETKFSRMVRDLCMELGKKVKFIQEGWDTEVDKTIIKKLESPLMHIIRNSIDHGIEAPEVRKELGKTPEGYLKLISYYSGAHVIIQVQDDGAGIDLEKVKSAAIKKGYLKKNQVVTTKELISLLFYAGFTTKQNVSMVSGRGVGMDVVKQEIDAIRGSIELDTEKGLGTVITIRIPVTLSITDMLHVTSGKFVFLIPVSDIEMCYSEKHQAIFDSEHRQIEYNDNLIPFIYLREIFNIDQKPQEIEKIVIVKKGDKHVGIVTDKILGESQAVLKPLGSVFKNHPFLSGGSILGSGEIALAIDINKLINYTEHIYNTHLMNN
ncbi:MAG: chemotaxis protein CheA [Bacteroidales bacterium]|nr:chemotaxis protein CheA [Bacteroidales bacterium]